MMIAALIIRRGFKNRDIKPSRARSLVVKLGALRRDLLCMISCCFKSRFPALPTVRARRVVLTRLSRYDGSCPHQDIAKHQEKRQGDGASMDSAVL